MINFGYLMTEYEEVPICSACGAIANYWIRYTRLQAPFPVTAFCTLCSGDLCRQLRPLTNPEVGHFHREIIRVEINEAPEP